MGPRRWRASGLGTDLKGPGVDINGRRRVCVLRGWGGRRRVAYIEVLAVDDGCGGDDAREDREEAHGDDEGAEGSHCSRETTVSSGQSECRR